MNDGYAIMVSDFIRKALSSTGFLAKVSCEYEVGKKYTTLCQGRDKEIECVFNDDLNSCDITISFPLGEEPELFQPDKNKQVFFLEKRIKSEYSILGFKIVDSKEGKLIIQPIGDNQTIMRVDEAENGKKKEFLNLDKNKKYLLPLDENKLEELSNGKELEEYKVSLDLNEIYGEKSLCGLGCIYGDESSCCSCLYW